MSELGKQLFTGHSLETLREDLDLRRGPGDPKVDSGCTSLNRPQAETLRDRHCLMVKCVSSDRLRGHLINA